MQPHLLKCPLMGLVMPSEPQSKATLFTLSVGLDTHCTSEPCHSGAVEGPSFLPGETALTESCTRSAHCYPTMSLPR